MKGIGPALVPNHPAPRWYPTIPPIVRPKIWRSIKYFRYVDLILKRKSLLIWIFRISFYFRREIDFNNCLRAVPQFLRTGLSRLSKLPIAAAGSLAAIGQWFAKMGTSAIVTDNPLLFSAPCDFWRQSWSSQDICQTLAGRGGALDVWSVRGYLFLPE
jgi:hypothetical protein